MIVVTRSVTPDLYSMMSGLIPSEIRKRKYKGFDRSEDCLYYLIEILKDNREWIVNVDDDCFIHDWSVVEDLILYMKDNDFDYCGMPDGGLIPIRKRNWTVTNPFFTIFNGKKIELPELEELLSYGYSESFEKDKPKKIHEGLINRSLESPFNPLFYFLRTHHKVLNLLNVRTHSDGYSTIVSDLKERPFALHSWYSREYTRDPKQKERIDKLYKEALSYKIQ